MCLYTVAKKSFSSWIGSLIGRYRFVGPTARRDDFVFAEMTDASLLALDYTTTVLPPKKILLPPRETLLEFEKGTQGTRVTPIFDDRTTIIFGMHTCDLHAVRLVDRFFEQGAADQTYLRRRAATTIVSIECLQPCSPYSFCKSMGTYTIQEEYDLHLTDIGNAYVCEVGSDKGSALIDLCPDARQTKGSEIIEMNRTLSEKWSRFPDHLEADLNTLPSIMTLCYENPLWRELGERCLGCGVCNIVCPTCYCFDMVDEVALDLQHGERYRIWDSCQIDAFAAVAGGHNFRRERSDRLRHRFMHKAKYQYEALGYPGCVGCGRCAQSCLAEISPLDVFNRLHHAVIPGAAIHEELVR
jgi:sulfhydrogenase subunit beta (sulfur reductase)